MSYYVKQNLFLILPTEAKLGDPQLGRKPNCPWSKCRPWSTTKRRGRVSANPADALGTDMARTWKLNAVPLGRGSCTAVHRLPDIQFLPKFHLLREVCRHPAGNRGLLPGTANETGSRPTAATRISCRDTTVPKKTAGKGMLRLGFKLKFSFQGLWKSLPGLHKPSCQVKFWND